MEKEFSKLLTKRLLPLHDLPNNLKERLTQLVAAEKSSLHMDAPEVVSGLKAWRTLVANSETQKLQEGFYFDVLKPSVRNKLLVFEASAKTELRKKQVFTKNLATLKTAIETSSLSFRECLFDNTVFLVLSVNVLCSDQTFFTQLAAVASLVECKHVLQLAGVVLAFDLSVFATSDERVRVLFLPPFFSVLASTLVFLLYSEKELESVVNRLFLCVPVELMKVVVVAERRELLSCFCKCISFFYVPNKKRLLELFTEEMLTHLLEAEKPTPTVVAGVLQTVLDLVPLCCVHKAQRNEKLLEKVRGSVRGEEHTLLGREVTFMFSKLLT